MKIAGKKKELTEDERRECLLLRALFDAKKGRLGLSQQKIADEMDSTQGAIGHYLAARNALNLRAAVVFSKALQEPISAFSPRLAKEQASLSGATPELASRKGSVAIPRTNLIASMGYGADYPDSQEISEWVEISREWAVRQRIVLSKPENLAMIEGLGNSMEGVFNHGDILIVDRGVREVAIDGVYVFQFEGKVWIKTLQRLPGRTLQAISNNKTYDPFLITENNGSEFAVLGKVVWIWSGAAV